MTEHTPHVPQLPLATCRELATAGAPRGVSVMVWYEGGPAPPELMARDRALLSRARPPATITDAYNSDDLIAAIQARWQCKLALHTPETGWNALAMFGRDGTRAGTGPTPAAALAALYITLSKEAHHDAATR